MQGKYFSFAMGLIVVLVFRCEPAHGITVDLGASQDNTLYEDPNGTLSNGAGPAFFAGVSGQGRIQRGLLQFDVAGDIPSGATVTSATLTLYMSRESNDSISENIQLHRVQAEWGEGSSVAPDGGGGGGPATPGDATWTHRIHPNDAWISVGGDFSGTVSASQSVLGFGFHSWGSTQLISDVQDWLDDPNTSFGWLLQGNEAFSRTSKRFDSRENSVASHRPVLAIEYESSGGLTADFNGDGFVDGLDLAIWEAAYGVNDNGDTDGDNDSDGVDFLNWQQQFTSSGGLTADFNKDSFVDDLDLAIWEAAYGINNNGDTDDDTDSDGVDFLNWQQQFTGPPPLQAVPEPACMALLFLGAVLALGTRYRRSMGT